MTFSLHSALVLLCLAGSAAAQPDSLIFREKNGMVAVESEHFYQQLKISKRKWYLTSTAISPGVKPDADPNHAADASGKAYVEILPDTRRTHDDPLVKGENFTNSPGEMAIVSYAVYFQTPGRYYVWVRAYSTGTEDNGIHVGLNGDWPASGARMQWCNGKNSWYWESKQRTNENHCGEPYKIYLDVKNAGLYTVSFSMREDGFEFDKWLMSTDRLYKPSGGGPDELPNSAADTTAPPVPEISALEVVGENNIHISWFPVVDPESELAGYTVYRDDKSVATVSAAEITFLDSLPAYETPYTYRVSAVNEWALESKPGTARSITTLRDQTPPALVCAVAGFGGNILAVFSEPVRRETAENSGFYAIRPLCAVQNALLLEDQKTTSLTTGEHIAGEKYTLAVTGLQDQRGNIITGETSVDYVYAPNIWLPVSNAELRNGARIRRYRGALNGYAGYCPAANSEILFEFSLPAETAWYLWGRLYYDGDTGYGPNMFHVRVDSRRNYSLGNNSDYMKEWHYDGDGEFDSGAPRPLDLGVLSAGPHEITVRPYEPVGDPGSARMLFDGLVLTASPDYRPVDFSIPLGVVPEPASRGPRDPALISTYPNPFNSTVTIKVSRDVRPFDVFIYDSVGRIVFVKKGLQESRLTWQADRVSTGVYFVRVTGKNSSAGCKILLLK